MKFRRMSEVDLSAKQFHGSGIRDITKQRMQQVALPLPAQAANPHQFALVNLEIDSS